MYQSFFGLRQAPFSIAPDPRYLFMSERHREALAHLLYGVDAGGGFVLLSGDIGAGKTTVCRCFLDQVPGHCQVAYIFNPKLSVTELLQTVCDEFGVAVAPAGAGVPTVKSFIDPLNAFLLEAHAQHRHCVLVIDEAQNLSADVLEQLRLLTNLETPARKLLQIILIGQPELRAQLARPELAQLAQRVIARFHLDALSSAETAAYVAHRLAVAGHSGGLPFDRATLRLVHRLSGGVPRKINLLCDRALLGAYAQASATVSRRTIVRAAAEVFDRGAAGTDRRSGSTWRWAAWALGAAMSVAALAVAWQARTAAADSSQRAATASARAAVAAAAASAPPAAPASTSTASANQARVIAEQWQRFDSAADFGLLPRDERPIWRELAAMWAIDPGAGDPCVAAVQQRLLCYRSVGATLATILALDRPGLITLVDAQGRLAHALLVGIDRQNARLVAGPQRWTLPLTQLAGLWRGDFATFWRAPDGYSRPLGEVASGPAVDALATVLAQVRNEAPPAPGAKLDSALRARLASFQLGAGLVPDGVAGPTTFMALNRALHIPEPQLLPASH
jgi:general secretion pathway protein A